MSNLLNKASIVTTPTAYDNGKILSVKPAPSLGVEKIVNGTFDENVNGWITNNANASFVWQINKTALFTSTSFAYVRASPALNLNAAVYKVSFDILSFEGTLSNVHIGLGNTANVITTTGSYTYFYTSTGGSAEFQIRPNSGGTGSITIDNVSVKQVIDGDFDFTRNSSATRVNSQGLIEDVQILSSNLVSNGDFSQEGSELVTNGDFATDSNWSKSGQVTIGGGVAYFDSDGTFTQIAQTLSGISGKNAKVVIEVTEYNQGTLKVLFSGGAQQNLPTSVGTHTLYFSNVSSNTLNIARVGGVTDIKIDNVSVKEVGQDWVLETDWGVGNNKAIRTGTASSGLTQSGTFSLGKKFKLNFTITDWTTGNLQGYFYGGGGSDAFFNISNIGNGTFTFETTTTTNRTNIAFYAFGGFDGSVTNIKIIEITDDTNLPRIDYTGGVGHWLFEPQSTNKVTYSEDFTQWARSGGGTLESGYLAPDGSNNAYKVSGTSSSSLYLASITNTTDTRTIWARTVSGTGDVYLCGNLNDANALFTVTSQWQRFELNGFTGGGATSFYAVDFRGSSTLTEVIIWGAQAEASSFATSYIPTSGSTVTRLQDAAFGAGSSDLINSTEGVLYAEIASLADFSGSISINDATVSNRIELGFTSSSRAIIYMEVGGVLQVYERPAVSDITSFYKIAFKWKLNDFSLHINGNKVATSSNGVTPSANTFNNLSFNGFYSNNFFGKTKCVAVFKEALTDEELTCLTTI